MEFMLNVYNEKGDVVKTCRAARHDLKFGTVRALMELFESEDTDNTEAMLKAILKAWGNVAEILSECFPEMTYEDWEYVKVKELLPLVVSIMRYSFSEIMGIPKEKN